MRAWILPALGLLLLLAGTLPARAQQQPIFRCIGAHGEPVFSGQPCGTPAPAQGASAGIGAGAVGTRCAASPQALREAIAGAFASHDVNQLAGLMVWRGVGQASARASLESLARWLRQPLSGIAATYANGPPAPGGTAATPGPDSAAPATASSAAATGALTGLAVSTGGGDGSTRDFGVMQSGGCWWLTF